MATQKKLKRSPIPEVECERIFLSTPVGRVVVELRAGCLAGLDFLGQKSALELGNLGNISPFGCRVAAELREYFAGERTEFSVALDLSCKVKFGEFEMRVLEELLKVPYGATVSYGELARRCGSPGAARAVGNAMRKNPVPVFVPCHRVVNGDGSVGRYSGGEGVKPFLLDFEKNILEYL